MECEEELSERFEDIVGVTLYEDRPVEHIVFWVSDRSRGYIETKPIHASQTPIRKENEQMLRAKYPMLEGGMFFSIDCIENYELIALLCSYGSNLIVLEPQKIRDAICERVSQMLDNYNKVVKK